jgi:hypothetical protein
MAAPGVEALIRTASGEGTPATLTAAVASE